MIRFSMINMLADQGSAPEASWLVETARNSTMEVGAPHDGFHFVTTIDQEGQQCNSGDC